MSFQKCPVCGGCGWTGVGFPTGQACHVCNGTGIISEQSGNPPYRKVTYGTDTNGVS